MIAEASIRARRWLALAAAVSILATAAEASTYAGKSLEEALQALRREAGLKVVFSEALVRGEMRVTAEPEGSTPAEVLAALLRPHGLRLHEGPDGSLLVVPAVLDRRPAAPRSAIRGVVFEQGSLVAVAGVEVTVPEADRKVTTGRDGRFELSGVPPGTYRLEARKAGFVLQELDALPVTAGHVTDVRLALLPIPTTLDEIVVTPPLEVGSIHDGTILHQSALERVPHTRDPWAVVSQTPGVLTDRINVGGNESGTQGTFLAPGLTRTENVFELDGVNTTDMAATGATAFYYDFDQLEEIRISTGGSDVRTQTAGVSVSMVTRRGGDESRGSARALLTDDDGFLGLFTAGSADVHGDLAPGQGDLSGNQVERIFDAGVEWGGPLVAGRLWIWGSSARTDIDLLAIGRESGERGDPDGTLLDYSSLKLNAQLAPSHSAVLFANHSNKRKQNRGAGPNRAPETTWRQDGPSDLAKIEDSRLLGSRLLLTGQASFIDGGFELIPHAGTGLQGGEALLADDGIWRNGFPGGSFDRDSTDLTAQGSLYLAGRATPHSLDFGASRRGYHARDSFRWPGPRQAYVIACEQVGGCESGDLVVFERKGDPRLKLQYHALWIQDAFETGRFSLKAGLRLDLQDGSNLPGTVAPNPTLPDVLPGFEFAGNDGGFDWATAVPRLAATYAFDPAGRTLLRLSFAGFSGQLAGDYVARLDPTASVEARYRFSDLNGDGLYQEEEPLTFQGTEGIDPASPFATPHRTAPDLRPERTEELLAGIERVLGRDWVLGLNVTYRRITDILEQRPLVVDPGGSIRPATAADYVFEQTVAVTLPDGREAAVDFYALKLPYTGGQLLRNGERSRDYFGLTFSFNRRQTARFMSRGYLSFGNAQWQVPPSFTATDDPTAETAGGDVDGALFAVHAPGNGKDNVFIQGHWAAQVSGFYQVAPERRWGFTLGWNFFARQGYPIPYDAYLSSRLDAVQRRGALTETEDFRNDDVYTLDLRLEKELGKRRPVVLSLAAFNVFDAAFVLQRERNLSGPQADYLLESLAPRIFRFGVRVKW